MSNLVIDLWDISQPYLQHRHIVALYNMFEEFRIDNNLPEQENDGTANIFGMTKSEFLPRLSDWAYNKYKMKVLTQWRDDRAVQSITISFDDMTEPEVFEVFVTLFSGPEI